MKKLFFLITIIFTNFAIAQTAEITGVSSVEVGINNNYNFNYKTNTNDSAYDKYRISYILISASGGANVNNTGNFSITDYTFFGSEYNIGVNNSINRPISFSDVGTFQSDSVQLEIGYQKRNKASGYWENFNPLRTSFEVIVNRIKQPVISTPVILACCSNNVTFSASDFGAANTFNWNNISGGTIVAGQGTSNITVAPDLSLTPISFICTVGRSQNIVYNKITNKYVEKTARTLGTIQKLTTGAYMCKNQPYVFEINDQCGVQNVLWSAPNCIISAESISGGKRRVTITPTNSITTGNSIAIIATATFLGGCSANATTSALAIVQSEIPPSPNGTAVLYPTYDSFGTKLPVYNVVFENNTGDYVNGITTVSPQTVTSRPQPRTLLVTICNKNYCNNQTTCVVQSIIIPIAPGSEITGFDRLAIKTDNVPVAFPNPTTGQITFSLPSQSNGSYRITDMTGKSLQQAIFNNSRDVQIELNSNLLNGIYLLDIQTSEETITKKIILKR